MNETMEMADFKTVKEGDIVTGTIVSIDDEGLLVHIGTKAEAFVPSNQIHNPESLPLKELFKNGDEMEAVVVKTEGEEGQTLLSQKQLAMATLWKRIAAFQENGDSIEARVVKAVKGGLILNLEGLEAFMPASHATLHRGDAIEGLLEQTVTVKVIEVVSERRKVVVSRRMVLQEEAAENKRKILASLQEGAIVKGIVRRLATFGAFVDLGGIDGLLHVSDMSWTRIKHPKDAVSEGDEIEVAILKVDPETEKISLSLKQVLKDPWEDVESRFRQGSIVTGTITRLADFGAFVRLSDDGIEGLLPISELSSQRVERVDSVVKSGQTLSLKVISANAKTRRISLSIKRMEEEAAKAELDSFMTDQSDTGTTTIGDLFGDLLNSLKEE